MISAYRYTLKSDLFFLTSAIALLMVVSTLARLLLLSWNIELAEDLPTSSLLMAFIVGSRFDLMMSCTAVVPLTLLMFFPRGLTRRFYCRIWIQIIAASMILTALVEPIFYFEFHAHLNSIALQYLKEDTATVLSMVWEGTPVVILLAVWVVFNGLFWLALRCLDLSNSQQCSIQQSLPWFKRLPVILIIFLLVIAGGRGTLRSGAPLRWGDSVHSDYVFANDLALNGVFTFSKAVLNMAEQKGADVWLEIMPRSEAHKTLREMILVPTDSLLAPSVLPLYRETVPASRKVAEGVENVVFILMESFTGQYVGSLGAPGDVTPQFDALAAQGVLFERAFSQGTHTHQGMYATFACFPSLPGYAYLMQQPEGDGQFSGFPAVMRNLGYKKNVYVYNGAFNWDNQQGFFRKQGISRFIGRGDMTSAKFSDPTWGVSDEDMFDRSIEELDRLHGLDEQPFFAMLQTLSNHMPFALPEPLPVDAVTGFGSHDLHLTAMRYSDYALGKFFQQAKTKSWYDKTLFVIFGDHGFPLRPQLTAIDLLRFHVPVLMLAPGLQESVGPRITKVTSQVDLVNTAASALGRPFKQHCWGRDILSLPENDSGFAIVKPSGNEPIVALIEGGHILVKKAGLKAQLYSYNLTAPASAKNLKGIDNSDKMQRLNAYIQSGINSLRDRETGSDPNLSVRLELEE